MRWKSSERRPKQPVRCSRHEPVAPATWQAGFGPDVFEHTGVQTVARRIVSRAYGEV